jgi:hypothetical protein
VRNLGLALPALAFGIPAGFLLVALKGFGVISWPWLVVLSPFAAFVVALVVAVVFGLTEKKVKP